MLEANACQHRNATIPYVAIVLKALWGSCKNNLIWAAIANCTGNRGVPGEGVSIASLGLLLHASGGLPAIFCSGQL